MWGFLNSPHFCLYLNIMRGFYVYITPEEYDGYVLLSDIASVIFNEGGVPKEDDKLVQKFHHKMFLAHEKGKELNKKEIIDAITVGCDDCMFCEECQKMERYIRQYTTSTIDLCQVINNWVEI